MLGDKFNRRVAKKVMEKNFFPSFFSLGLRKILDDIDF